jgi:hypothetical protein
MRQASCAPYGFDDLHFANPLHRPGCTMPSRLGGRGEESLQNIGVIPQSDDISPVAGFFDLELDVVRFDAACFAQRAFCARLIFLRAVADIVRVPSDVEPLYAPTNALSAAFNADNCSYSVPSFSNCFTIPDKFATFSLHLAWRL